jgi:putative transposase
VRRSKITVPLHLVWRTKNNDPWIEPCIERRLHRAIVAEATALEAQVLAINGTQNHVHLAVLFPATVRICDFVKQLKGASSRLATTELLGRSVYWQEGYGAFAFQINLAPKVIGYIRRQKEHHRTEGNL